MSWKEILKSDSRVREELIEQADEKTTPIIEALMRSIDTYEEQIFSPREVASGSHQKELEKEYAYAYVYDTAFGRVSFTITMDGRVLDGYFEDNNGEITMADTRKKNKQMQKDEEDTLSGERGTSAELGYFETPDEYYYN